MKITVRQLKRLIREAIEDSTINDKEAIKNKLSEQLEETFSELDMSDEDAMYDILFEKSDFILDRMVDADFATEVESVISKREIAKIIADWQKNKINTCTSTYIIIIISSNKLIENRFYYKQKS